MKLSKDDILNVADLARIDMSEDEVVKITRQVSDILGYVEILENAETKDIRPTSHDTTVSNIFREDCVNEVFTKEKALANAPRSEYDHFVVPKSIG